VQPYNDDEDITPFSRTKAIQRLVAQVEALVRTAGNQEGFNANDWLTRWLDTPCPALARRKPGQLLDSPEGFTLVSATIARMSSGAYA